MSDILNCRARLAIILPSLDPDEKFSKVVNGLVDSGFQRIVIVDDGSDQAHQRYFEQAAAYPQCTVLHHGVNKGKGRALKTAFQYVLDALPEAEGVITIDGDGQHLTKDIIACGDRLLEQPDKVIMGCRNFDLPGVPARSVAGNKTTSRMFRLFFGIRLSDTQTGLRAISRQYLAPFCQVEGERFEYETNMLLQMKRQGIGFLEQPIETVYEDENAGSHYDTFKDSWRIFKIMFKFLMGSAGATVLKFLLSSAGATVLDLALFYLLMRLFAGSMGKYATILATVLARLCSSFANFNANNTVVFANKGSYRQALWRYYCLCIPQMAVSAGLVFLINHWLSNTVPSIATLVKMAVDVCLFFISYGIQRKWVFSQNKKK